MAEEEIGSEITEVRTDPDNDNNNTVSSQIFIKGKTRTSKRPNLSISSSDDEALESELRSIDITSNDEMDEMCSPDYADITLINDYECTLFGTFLYLGHSGEGKHFLIVNETRYRLNEIVIGIVLLFVILLSLAIIIFILIDMDTMISYIDPQDPSGITYGDEDKIFEKEIVTIFEEELPEDEDPAVPYLSFIGK